jgi:hypothetical protein
MGFSFSGGGAGTLPAEPRRRHRPVGRGQQRLGRGVPPGQRDPHADAHRDDQVRGRAQRRGEGGRDPVGDALGAGSAGHSGAQHDERLAARYAEPLSVFVGAWAALLVISGLAAFLGRKLADRLPVALLHRIAAGLFLVFAVIAAVETARSLAG